MADVRPDRPDITRIELIARESNRKAIRFYESLGFWIERELVAHIRNVDGSLESDIPLGLGEELSHAVAGEEPGGKL